MTDALTNVGGEKGMNNDLILEVASFIAESKYSIHDRLNLIEAVISLARKETLNDDTN